MDVDEAPGAKSLTLTSPTQILMKVEMEKGGSRVMGCVAIVLWKQVPLDAVHETVVSRLLACER